jgi:hypothetical protein
MLAPKTALNSKRAAAQSVSNQGLAQTNPGIEQQVQGELFAVVETEFDGVQMGVLNDGTPYLTMRGLARLCGVDNTVILRLTSNWDEESEKPRGKRISEILAAQGYTHPFLYFNTDGKFGETHAYVDTVCMAILEYYAFDASQASSETARRNYRLLARDSLRKYIYKACDYDPARSLSNSWRNFHERVLLNDQLPPGYFSVFKEASELVIRMIREGCELNDHTVPDGSVGICWARHWDESAFNSKYGERTKHDHYYPDWFPQSAANPIPAWIYPDESLAAFRRWMNEVYLPFKYPNYLQGKVKKGDFLPAQAKQLLGAVARPALLASPGSK